MSESLDAALQYVREFGWYVVPLWWIKEDGTCACRRGAKCGRSSGKHPITPNGINDATRNEEIINAWYKQYPDAGVAANIERSELVLLGPDSVEWQQKFEDKGLHAGGAIIDTGGGEGHFHYIHKRPPEMPITRINRSGEFDLMTEGVLPLPPSKHYSGKQRTWVVPPSKWLPFAPSLTVQMAQIQKEKEVQVELSEIDVDGPPVRLSGIALDIWNGKVLYKKDKPNEVDRSRTLWLLECAMAEAGASAYLIAQTMVEWAPRWGVDKFHNRPDRYIEEARRAIATITQKEEKEKEAVEGLEEINIYSLRELLNLEFEKPPMFVDPIIPSTGITLFAGASGSLKTAITADLFLAIYEQRTWLGHYRVPPVSKILYLDGELGHQALQLRLQSMGAQPSDDLDYIYRSWRIENDKEFDWLMKLVKERQYELILVDSLSAMHSLEEKTDTTLLVMRRLRQLADACNCPIVVLAHFNKTTSEKRELLERISGPSVYRNKATSIVTLRRFGGKKVMKVRMQLQKNWFGQEGDARTLELAKDGEYYRFKSEEWVPPNSEDDDEEEKEKATELGAVEMAELQLGIYLAGYDYDQPIGWNELIEFLSASDKVSKEKALQVARSAIAQGAIREPERIGRGGKMFTFKVRNG